MKILMATDTYWPRINGVTVAVDTLRKSLSAMGHAVSIIAPRYGRTEGAVADPEGIHRFPSMSPPMSREDRFVFPFLKKRVRRMIESFQPDIVHAHTEFTLGQAGKKYAELAGIPLIMTCHTLWEQYVTAYIPELPASVSRKMVRRLSLRFYRDADAVIVPSEAMRTLLTQYGLERPVAVVPTGVDLDAFSAEPSGRDGESLQGSFPLLSGRRILLYVGRVAHEKNIGFLLDVLVRVLAKDQHVILVIAGDGPARQDLERQVKDLGLGSSVIFTGYLNRSAISSLYSRTEVFCFASKTETQGLVLLEAMVHGTPFVALSHGGTADILADGRGGFVSEEDPDRFAGKVLSILHDAPLRERLAKDGRQYAESWTAPKMAQRLLSVYEDAVRGRARGAGGAAG